MSFFIPYIAPDKVEVLENLCKKENITILNLLDVGLAQLNVDQVTAYESITRETMYLDSQKIIDALNMAKILGNTLKIDPAPEHHIVALLLLLKVCIVNMLGYCGKDCFQN